jgi:hypothetical protein
MYLWHYTYESSQDISVIGCDTDFIDKHALTYVKRHPRERPIQHRITWYLKPKKYAFPEKPGFENYDVAKLQQETDISAITNQKTVCFGPVMHKVTNDQVIFYRYYCKVHYSFKIGFTGRRSLAPGFASLKEKPAGFKRTIKGKEV